MGVYSRKITMADVKIRKLPDWVVAAHKSRAQNAKRSLEEELRLLLTAAALKPRQDLPRKIAAFRNSLRRKHGLLPDSTPRIREDRETRG
jgi:plasmid stability protein